LAQIGIARTGLGQVGAALISGQFQRCGKHRNFGVGRFAHGNSIIHHLIRKIEAKRAKNLADLNWDANWVTCADAVLKRGLLAQFLTNQWQRFVRGGVIAMCQGFENVRGVAHSEGNTHTLRTTPKNCSVPS